DLDFVGVEIHRSLLRRVARNAACRNGAGDRLLQHPCLQGDAQRQPVVGERHVHASIVTSRTVRGSCWFSRDCSSAAVKVSLSEPNMLQTRPAADKIPTSATTIQAILRFDMTNLRMGTEQGPCRMG